MKVWVLEIGCYSDKYVQGVYSTPQKAMDAMTGIIIRRDRNPKRTYTWSGPDEQGWYNFDADWDDAANITPYLVDGNATD